MQKKSLITPTKSGYNTYARPRPWCGTSNIIRLGLVVLALCFGLSFCGGRGDAQLSIADARVDEGDSGTTDLVFTVSLDRVLDDSVEVNYHTEDVSAFAGEDYTEVNGRLTIPAGRKSADIIISVMGDTTVEPNEFFMLTLSNPSNKITIRTGMAAGTIVADDLVMISIAEGNSGTTNRVFTVSLDRAADSGVTIDYNTHDITATVGEDYFQSSGTLFIPAGFTERNINVMVRGNSNPGPDETFMLTLSNPSSNARLMGDQAMLSVTGTIINNADENVEGKVLLSISDARVEEGNSSTTDLVFTVNLSQTVADDGNDITVDYATSNGTATAGEDYTAANGTLTIPLGESMPTITIVVNGDTNLEEDETLTLTLSNPSANAVLMGGEPMLAATGTIVDDDMALVSISDASVTEGNSSMTNLVFTVSLNKAVSQNVTVDYATSDGTGTAGTDYTEVTSGMVTIPAGMTSTDIIIVVTGETNPEEDETLTLTFSNLSVNAEFMDGQSTLTATGTIVDDDMALVSIADTSVAEGNSGNTDLVFTVSLNRAVSQDVTVDYATSDGTATAGTDYTEVTSGMGTIPAGDTSTQITILVTGEATAEPNETMMLTLSNPSANAEFIDGQSMLTATGTITADDGPLLSIDDASVEEGDSGTTNLVFTVNLSQPVAGNVTVDYATLDGTATITDNDYITASDTLTISGGSNSAQLTISVIGDTNYYESDETFMVRLSNPSSNAVIGSPTAIGTIINDDRVSVVFTQSSFSVPEADGPAMPVVRLGMGNEEPYITANFDVTVVYRLESNTAILGEDTVEISSVGAVTIPAGESFASIPIGIISDTLYEKSETLRISILSLSAYAMRGSPRSAVVTILDDDANLFVSIANTHINEGNAGSTDMVFTVSVVGGLHGGDAIINYATSDGTTIAGEDYTEARGQVTIARSSLSIIPTQVQITISVTGDTHIEPNETFKLTLSSGDDRVTLTDDTATGVIVNDD